MRKLSFKFILVSLVALLLTLWIPHPVLSQAPPLPEAERALTTSAQLVERNISGVLYHRSMLEGMTAIEQFWTLIRGAWALHPDAFRAMESHPNGTSIAVIVVLLVGLSQGIGQGIVLFLNRVKPIRFVLSLGIAALLFVFSTGFWVLSVWGVSHVVYGADVSFLKVFRVLGLAYAPLLWSFLVALPYLGVPIEVLLSIWSLLAFVRGGSVVTDLDRWQVMGSAILGWFVLQIMQRTIGRPAVALGRWVSNTVAGAPLVTDLRQLEQRVQSGFSEFTEEQAGDEN